MGPEDSALPDCIASAFAKESIRFSGKLSYVISRLWEYSLSEKFHIAMHQASIGERPLSFSLSLSLLTQEDLLIIFVVFGESDSSPLGRLRNNDSTIVFLL